MRQAPSRPTTRYGPVKRPVAGAGYIQRIPMWDAVERLKSANQSELLSELRKVGYARPNHASLDEAYCRIELPDMTKRGGLRRLEE